MKLKAEIELWEAFWANFSMQLNQMRVFACYHCCGVVKFYFHFCLNCSILAIGLE
jgi:hypothetical protein